MDDDGLRDSLQELYEHAPCGYIFALPDGTLTRVNRTFLDLTGYAREELLRLKRFQDLLTVPGKLFYENQYAPLLRLQGFVKEVTFDLVRKDGGRLPVLVNAVQRTDAQGHPIEVASTVFEAADRRKYEQELLLARRRAEQLAAVLTVSDDAILSARPNGEVQTWNPGAERLFRRTPEEMIGRRLGDLIPLLGDPAEWQRILGELRAGRSVQVECVSLCAGRQVDVSVGLAPHLGQLGELSALSLIIRDITAIKDLERQKDEFLTTMSHDLKNPLTGIKGWAQILIRRAGRLPEAERERWREDLATIEGTAARMAAMVDELLDLTHLQMGRPLELRRRPTDLVALARRVAADNQQLAEEHTIVVRSEFPRLEGLWDQARLERVVGNLLSNAIKYSPEGGEITLAVAREETPGSTLAVLSVRDRGIGIPTEDLPRVFERFYRAANVVGRIAGTGIGLAGAKQLVELHGGSIRAESSPGQGSTFTVRLPLAASEA